MIIAIDGPAGSGKTTISKLLANELSIFYLDTGATYRVLTLKALETKVDLKDEKALQNLAKNLDLKFAAEKVFLEGRDVSFDIRTPEIDKNISIIVSYQLVRQVMVDLQRQIAKEKDCVVEGRDITTVVFPTAEYKFYLDANFSIRAKRRFDEFQDRGVDVDFLNMSEGLKKRDSSDFNREVGPLKRSADAIYVDTTGLSIEEVVNVLKKYIQL